MATDATGTPTTVFSIPKYNTAVDAPSGLGLNAAMDAIDAALNTKVPHAFGSGLAADEVPVWNGSAWVYQKVTTANLADSAVTNAKANLTYSAYTPTWTSDGTAPSLGNGVLVGRFMQVGKFVHAMGAFVAGSTTTFGTGNYFFALPVSANNSTTSMIGFVRLADASSGNVARADGLLGTVSTLQAVYGTTFNGTASAITNTLPWTWANGDSVAWNLTYEAA